MTDSKQFTKFLIKVIPQITGKLKANLYLGLDLREAANRLLYIEGANSAMLQSLFEDDKKKENRLIYVFFKRTVYDIAKAVLREKSAGSKPLIFLINTEKIIFFLRNCYKFFFRLVSGTHNEQSSSNLVPRVLAVLHHPKFVPVLLQYFKNSESALGFIVSSPVEREKLQIPPRFPVFILEKRNHHFRFLCFKYSFLSLLVEKFDTFFKDKRTSFIITFEGDAPYQEVIAQMGKKYGISTACIQWGAFPWETPKLGFRNMTYDIFFTWGDYFSDQLKPWNLEQRFCAVGNPSILVEQTLPAKQIVFIHQGFDDVLITRDTYRSFWNLLIWAAENFPEWNVILRNHPNVPLTSEEISWVKQKGIIHHNASELSLLDTFRGTAMAVTIMSSSVIEGFANGVMPVIFNSDLKTFGFKPDFKSIGLGLEEDNIEALKPLMTNLLTDFNALLKLREAIFQYSHKIFHATGSVAAKSFQQILFNQNNFSVN